MNEGLLIGQFSPLTLAHLQHINTLIGQVDTLHIVVLPSKTVNAQTAARWLSVSFSGLDFIKIHTPATLGLETMNLDTIGMDKDQVAMICQTLGLNNPVIFDKPAIDFGGFDTLAPACRYFYSTKIAIVGGESSGKTTLIQKLANHYGTGFIPELGRLYTHSHLGGTEVGLQYSDYPVIANLHADAIYKNSQAFLTLIDTDFITTQVFCEMYERRSHPMLDAFIKEFHPKSDNPFAISHTLYLDNNVKWVADGMRRLGNQRSEFAQALLDHYAAHDIPLHIIDSPDYHERYLQAVAIIDKLLSDKPSPNPA